MPADPDLLEDVYWFARAREKERVDKALKRGGLDWDDRRMLQSALHNLQWAYAEAKRAGRNEAIAAAIDVCRQAAMKDRDHPDFDPVWGRLRANTPGAPGLDPGRASPRCWP
jgi:hypothetical protein